MWVFAWRRSSSHLQIRVIHDDLNLLSLVWSGVCIISDDLNFLTFCIDSWGSVLGHILFLIIWVFGTNFAVADLRPALLYF